MRSLDRLVEFGADLRFLNRGTGWRKKIPLTLTEFGELFRVRVEYMLLEFHLNQTIADFSPRIPLTLGEFSSEDLTPLRLMQRPSQVDLCRERLSRGHIGIAAHAQSELAGYFWGCTDFDPGLERLDLPLEAGGVYMSDSYTVPTRRGNGIFTAMLLECLRTYKRRGYTRAITCVDASSPITSRVCLREGFREIARFEYTRVGGRRRVRWLSTNQKVGIVSETAK